MPLRFPILKRGVEEVPVSRDEKSMRSDRSSFGVSDAAALMTREASMLAFVAGSGAFWISFSARAGCEDVA